MIKRARMRFLLIVTYDERAAHERDMYSMLKRVYGLQHFLATTLFIVLDPTVEVPVYDAGTWILRLPGTESVVPGVLDKTVRALHWAFSAGFQFEYVVRSNISTLIQLPPLNAELRMHEAKDARIHYAGGHVLMLSWIDAAHGIVSHDLFGMYFASGSCIVLSQKCARDLLHCSLDRTIVDDVAIAAALLDKQYTPHRFSPRFFFWTSCASMLDHAWADTALINIKNQTVAQLHAIVESRGRDMIAFRHNAFKADGADDQEENKRDRDVKLMRITAHHVEKWLA